MTLFEAIPNVEKFEFWRKSLGFISLFFKISILSLVLKANNFLRSKMQQDDSRKKAIFSIVLALVWLGLVTGFYYGWLLARQIYDQYDEKALTAYLYYEVPFVPSNFSIAICEAVYRDPEEPNSLIKLKEPAKRFNSSNFIVKFGIVEQSLVLSKVRFFYKSFNQTRLEHCFSTDVFINEAR